MGPFNIVKYGLGSVALVGVATMLFSKFASGGFSLDKIFGGKKKDEHDNKQNIILSNIESTNKKQKIITDQIKLSEKASEKTKKKINKIYKQAAVEVETALKQDKIETIAQSIDQDWDDI